MTKSHHRSLMGSAATITEVTPPKETPRFVTKSEVLNRLALKKSWLHAAIAAGTFPAPLRTVNARRCLFDSQAVDAWFAEKTGANTPAAASDKAR